MYYAIEKTDIMKSLILLLAISALPLSSIAQQDIQISNFDYFSSFYNPATITNTKLTCGNIIGRNQWSGLNGRPNTGFINTSHNFSNYIWGNLAFANDVIGLQKSNIVKLGLAKPFHLTPSVLFSVGLNINYARYGWTSNFITPDTPVRYDNSIPNTNISAGNFDMDAGIYIKANNVSIGLSSTHLTQPSINQPNFNFKHKRHYYVLAGYNKQIQKGNFENFILAKSDAASTQMDFKSNFWHNTGWMVGLAYRLSDAIIPMIGYQQTFGRINVRGIYSYDITTSQLNQYSSGSHEICLKVCIGPEKFTERYTHPRHLGTWH